MATQKQLWNALRDAQKRGWKRIDGSTLAAPSNDIEYSTPDDIPHRWWPGKTYTRVRFLQFAVVPDKHNNPRINGIFYRTQNAPWVDPMESQVPLYKAIEILESE